MKLRYLAVLLLVTPLAQAGDAAAGKAKSAQCMACHGPAGVSQIPIYPNLAGQKEQYLAAQLKAFRDGSRPNPIMGAQAKMLSDADIDNLAAYFSGLDPKG